MRYHFVSKNYKSPEATANLLTIPFFLKKEKQTGNFKINILFSLILFSLTRI